MEKDLNRLSKEVFEANKAKGFHDEEISNETLLMLVVTELSEAVEADRKAKRANFDSYDKELNYYNNWSKDSPGYKDVEIRAFSLCVKDTVEDELADAVIRLLDLAGLNGVKIMLNDIRIDEFSSCLSEESFPEMIFHVCREAVRCPANSIVELEDVIPRTLEGVIAICKHLSIDLWQHVDLKIKYNKTRPNKHGKKY